MVNVLSFLFVYAATVFIAWAITGRIRQFAVERDILDYPTDRSSHTAPTPRGGGLSIVLILMAAVLVLWFLAPLTLDIFLALAGGILLVAAMGWLDDRYNVPAGIRAAVYLLAAAWAAYWVTGIPGVENPRGLMEFGIAVIAIAWLTNLYNFMDGTDALAGSQAICTALMAAVLLFLQEQNGLAMLCLALSAACAGFLIWNWPPARIFMGDVGSCTIGFVFGALALISHSGDVLPLAAWLILLSLFISDASLTLVKRMAGGESWYRAHRSHAYQLAVRLGLSHKRLNNGVILINLLILLPLSYTVYQVPAYQWQIAGSVYVLMAGLWLYIQIKYRLRYRSMETE